MTFSGPHNFVAGDPVLVSGIGAPIDTPFDQTEQRAYILKSVTPTSITYEVDVSQSVQSGNLLAALRYDGGNYDEGSYQ